MTCFWDSIYNSLNNNHFKQLECPKDRNLKKFINKLQNKKTSLENVTWQNNELSKKEIEEHLKAINEYNINDINKGHLTSSCDYFLLLLCDLFEIGIDHNFLGNIIKYRNKSKNTTILKFGSNRGHFYKV